MGGIKWQNLVKKKCPRCESALKINKVGFECSNLSCDFFITKKGLFDILTDNSHPIFKFLDANDLKIIENALSR